MAVPLRVTQICFEPTDGAKRIAVALYLVLALGAVQIWGILSHQGDAFAGSVLR